jgi:Zn-dependent oligopeptidase
MFTRFAKAGVLDPQTGREYRDDILARGREQEPDKLLAAFLGRAPDEHAFLHLLGIDSPKPPPPAGN